MRDRSVTDRSGSASDSTRHSRRTPAGSQARHPLLNLQRAAGNAACVAYVSALASAQRTGGGALASAQRKPSGAGSDGDARGRAAESVRDNAVAGPTSADLLSARRRLAEIRALVEREDSPLTREDRQRLAPLLAEAMAQLDRYQKLAAEGSSRTKALATIGVMSAGVLADDATVIGTVDDVALPLLGLAALITLVATRPRPSEVDLDSAWQNVVGALKDLSGAGAGIVLAVQGERLAGNTRQLATHLARLLGLGSVGGVPSGEPPKRNNDDDPHWWSEIKSFLKAIGQSIKGASRKQIMRELLRRGFTEEQILEIERRLIEAAAKFGERPPPFLPGG